MSARAAKVLHANMGATDQDSSLMIEGLKVTQNAMSPQGGMQDMNRRAANVTKFRLNNITDAKGASNVNLWTWIEHELTVATTKSVYREGNPYRDPKVEAAF
jgi:TnpA family transposase